MLPGIFLSPVGSDKQTPIASNHPMTPTIASVFNLVGPDMVVIFLIVLLLFGAKKLPELARGMGRAVKEFNAARDEVERGLTQTKSVSVLQANPPDTNKDLSSSP